MKLALLGLEALATGINESVRKAENKVGLAVAKGAKKVQTVGMELALTPFERHAQFRNVQDYRRRAQIRPSKSIVDVRVDLSKQEAIIMAKPHVTKVTPVVWQVAGKLGLNSTLIRRALYVAKGPGRRNKRGHESRAALQKVSLKTSWLADWAEDKDLDEKDTIRLKGEMLRIIVLKPALDRNAATILADIRKAVTGSL